MSFSETMIDRAKSIKKKLVLPEGTEPRTLAAARIILDKGIASKVFLVGVIKDIEAVAAENKIDLSCFILVDPSDSDLLQEFTEEYYELRKHKKISMELAGKIIKSPLSWGAMMLRKGIVDGMVAGAENSTGNVLIAAFTIIKTKPDIKTASSSFIMTMNDTKWGVDGNMVFSDCAIVIDPTAAELAEIAIASSDTCKIFLGAEPVTAMLSFSTMGSSKHQNIDKVKEALAIAKEKRPDLIIDGELQLDAAIVGRIGEKKAPGSNVAGKANVLVFPDLQSGNIGYKLTQRLAGADAWGPILQGFSKPVSDLSRGCSIEDIVVTSAMTLIQS